MHSATAAGFAGFLGAAAAAAVQFSIPSESSRHSFSTFVFSTFCKSLLFFLTCARFVWLVGCHYDRFIFRFIFRYLFILRVTFFSQILCRPILSFPMVSFVERSYSPGSVNSPLPPHNLKLLHSE